jgi:hypothetical protein
LLADLGPDAEEHLADAYKADAEGDVAAEEDALRELGGAMYRLLAPVREDVTQSVDTKRRRSERRAQRVALLPDDVVATSRHLLAELQENDR